MINQKLAHLFYQLAIFLEMDEAQFKPRAYERVAQEIEAMEEDLGEIYERGGRQGLKQISGIGEGIADKIEEFIKTGKIKELETLKRKIPVDIEALSRLEGVGPKTIKTLFKKLKIKNLEELEKAARARKIRKLEHFGIKSEENILSAIDFAKQDQGRFLLGYILPQARELRNKLAKLKDIKRVEIAGSLRRMKETIGDLDILAVTDNPRKVIEFFVSLPSVIKIYGQGDTKANVRLDWGIDADLRVVPEESFGAAWQYFTGSKEHNVALRKIAIEQGYKLNEYGVFKLNEKRKTKNEKNLVVGKKEESVYKFLGLQAIPPEARENIGEIELAQKGKFPKLIEDKDVLGDLQMHSTWSDGAYSIEEMARAAKKLGREYIAITDHAGRLAIAGGMKEGGLLKQMKEIDIINKKISGIKILKGAEVDIDKEGKLHIKDEVLAKLDVCLGSIHDNFKMNKEAMTERVCRAMENPHLDIWAHPSGRLLLRREGYEVDWDKVFKKAVATGTAIEINAFPERLDLSWQNVKKAVAMGVKLTIGTDSHAAQQLDFLYLGVAVARRGWAKKSDVLNTLDWKELLKHFKK